MNTVRPRIETLTRIKLEYSNKKRKFIPTGKKQIYCRLIKEFI